MAVRPGILLESDAGVDAEAQQQLCIPRMSRSEIMSTSTSVDACRAETKPSAWKTLRRYAATKGSGAVLRRSGTTMSTPRAIRPQRSTKSRRASP